MLYNSRRNALYFKVGMFQSRKVADRGWRGVLILVAVCALTSSLATRFYLPTTSQCHTTNSVEVRSPEPKRQHLDRDASHWVAPDNTFTLMQPALADLGLTPIRPVLITPIFGDSLYTRPPPSRSLSV